MNIGLIISFCLLVFSIYRKIFIGYTLISCYIIFLIISLIKGYKLKEVVTMSLKGGKESFIVLKLLTLIGAVIASWMACGTIPAIVYYCLKFITPTTFIISAFLICCLTSFLIGTATGTVSTVGIPLIIIARSGNINLNIAAGAIIAGAYFGDRCSIMSSSAALVANLTNTNVFKNVKNMIYSSIIPFLLSLTFYYIMSLYNPLRVITNNLSDELLKVFNIKPYLLIPAAIILILSLFKVKISTSIPISILSAFLISLFNGYPINKFIYNLIMGFKMDTVSELKEIIKGGGVYSMLKTCLIVFVSCCLAGIFNGIKMFDKLKNSLSKMSLNGYKLFGITSIISIITAAFGCTQAICVIMTKELMKDSYKNIDNYRFSLDIENSGIVFSPLIPWNIAAFFCTSIMNVSMAGYMPYAFYLYILPFFYIIYCKVKNIGSDELINENHD